ncbi:MAG: hypothetical protein AAFV49_03605 [Pseudomonadota bacterium]
MSAPAPAPAAEGRDARGDSGESGARATLLAILLGAAAGLACFALFSAPAQIFDPTVASAPPGDIAQSLSGAIAFLRDDWRFPILEAQGLAEGRAVNVAFTDSIPLYLIPWKLAGLGPDTAERLFLPVFFLLTFLLQGVCGALSLRILGVRGALALAAGATLFASFPVFLHRISRGHLALSGHWIVVLALALALLPFPQARRAAAMRFLAWAALLAAALLVHPYLFAMAGGLFGLALAIEALRRGRPGLPALAAGAAGVLGTILALMVAAGHLGAGGQGTGGYGFFNVNLAAFFMPLGHSAFLPQGAPFPHGQGEGFAYLPLALWALILAAAVLTLRAGRAAPLARMSVLGEPRARLLGALALGAVLLFASAGEFWWAETELLSLPLRPVVGDIGDALRSSGRFVWIAVYAALLLAVAAVALGLPRRWSGPALALAAGLSVAEMRPMAEIVPLGRGYVSGDDTLATLMRAADRVSIHPRFPCGDRVGNSVDAELQLLAARAAIPVANSFYSGRSGADCALPEAQAMPGRPPAGTLAVVVTEPSAPQMLAGAVPPEHCRTRQAMTFCLADWPARGALLPRFGALAAPLAVGAAEMAMSRGGAGAAFLHEGFSAAEDWGVWSEGPRSSLLIPVARPAPRRVQLLAEAYLPESRPVTAAQIRLEARTGTERPWAEQDRAEIVFERGHGRRRILLANGMEGAAMLRVTLMPEAPASPASLGEGGDPRPLGLALFALTLEP